MRIITLSLSLFSLLSITGCYTQLLTVDYIRSQEIASQYQGDSTLGTTENSTVITNIEKPCDCTPWEIQTQTCWCYCDRCGLYHRLGYEFCPTGIYKSYWGWDRFDRYPWWHRYSPKRRPSYNNNHNYYAPQQPQQPPSSIAVENKPAKNRETISGVPAPNIQHKEGTQSTVPDTTMNTPVQIQTRERPTKGRNQID